MKVARTHTHLNAHTGTNITSQRNRYMHPLHRESIKKHTQARGEGWGDTELKHMHSCSAPLGV